MDVSVRNVRKSVVNSHIGKKYTKSTVTLDEKYLIDQIKI
jgi:hypothetical protein